jgi:hypothetical protein
MARIRNHDRIHITIPTTNPQNQIPISAGTKLKSGAATATVGAADARPISCITKETCG